MTLVAHMEAMELKRGTMKEEGEGRWYKGNEDN